MKLCLVYSTYFQLLFFFGFFSLFLKYKLNPALAFCFFFFNFLQFIYHGTNNAEIRLHILKSLRHIWVSAKTSLTLNLCSAKFSRCLINTCWKEILDWVELTVAAPVSECQRLDQLIFYMLTTDRIALQQDFSPQHYWHLGLGHSSL